MGNLEQIINGGGGQFKFYKIRSKKTGLFSSPRGFNATGKVWANIGHAKNHIRMKVPKYRASIAARESFYREYLNDLEILEITVDIHTSPNIATIPIDVEKVLTGGSL